MATIIPSRAIELSASSSSPDECILWLASGSARDPVQQHLEANRYCLVSCDSVQGALGILSADPAPDLVLIDARTAAEEWAGWTAQLNAAHAQTPIILITGAKTCPSAILAQGRGLYDLVAEPFALEQVLTSVRRAVECHRLRVQNDLYQHHLERVILARTEILRRTMQQLERSYDVTLEALGDALDLKDAETQGHSKRVTAYTLALGRAMGLNEAQLRVVGRGAFLHDIGKMAIPDAILRKPGKLTAEERAIMCTHSELGYQMLRKIPFLRESAEIVYSHQECYDGSGYPRSLRGEQIHIGARIFALADTFDAITSNRPYRKANSLLAARKEVLRCAGTQFDPAIVDVFLATPDSIWQSLREGIMREGSAFSPFGYTFGDAG